MRPDPEAGAAILGRSARFDRSELYDQVWKEPLRVVAGRYGVSDVALGQICRRLQVPLPGKGHWTRVQFGKAVTRPPLPNLPPGLPSTITVERRLAQTIAVPEIDPSKPKVTVPAALRRPHKLIAEAVRLLRGREPNKGVVRCWNERCLDIVVAPESLGRAVRIMHSLIAALEERGMRVEVTRALRYEERSHRDERTPPDNATRVMVDGEWIEFGIIEKRSVATVEPVPPKGLTGQKLEYWLSYQPRKELVPTGELELRIKSWTGSGARSAWSDGKRQRLEGCLDEFIAQLSVTAGLLKRRRQEREQESRRYAELEAERIVLARRQKEEDDRASRFEDEVRRWRLARDIREYAREARGLANALTAPGPEDTRLMEFLKWAEAYANSIDPLTPMRVVPCSGQASPVTSG